MAGRTTSNARGWSLSKPIQTRPSFDASKAVGIACACYITIFILLLQAHGSLIQLLISRPGGVVPLVCGAAMIVVSLLLSWRMACLLAWAFMAMVASSSLGVSNFALGQSAQISLAVFGLGLPFLVLLEVILTMEGAMARARVVFRPRPLLKALIVSATVMLALLAAFSYIAALRQYSASPEAATFQTAMIAGLATIALASILLAQPRRSVGRS